MPKIKSFTGSLDRSAVRKGAETLEQILSGKAGSIIAGSKITRVGAVYDTFSGEVTYKVTFLKANKAEISGTTLETLHYGLAVPGTRVEVEINRVWYAGEITKQLRGRFQYAVKFDDGDHLKIVAKSCRLERSKGK